MNVLKPSFYSTNPILAKMIGKEKAKLYHPVPVYQSSLRNPNYQTTNEVIDLTEDKHQELAIEKASEKKHLVDIF